MLTKAFDYNSIPVVFACDEHFLPYTATAIASIMDTSSTENNYDIIILHRASISQPLQQKVLGMISRRSNISIRFLDITEYLRGVTFYTANRADLTEASYYRLLIPELLTCYDKAVYLDGDVIVCQDIAELYNMDVSAYDLAACRDFGSTGFFPCHGSYRKDVLHLEKPEDYICAGVLLMNLAVFREKYPIAFLMEYISSHSFLCHDQDVLNTLCAGHILLLPLKWDCMPAAKLPSSCIEQKQEPYTALLNPSILHFVSASKLNHEIPTNFIFLYGKYAGMTPFFSSLLPQATFLDDLTPPEQLVIEYYRRGRLGLRYILKYIRAWVQFKLHGYHAEKTSPKSNFKC